MAQFDAYYWEFSSQWVFKGDIAYGPLSPDSAYYTGAGSRSLPGWSVGGQSRPSGDVIGTYLHRSSTSVSTQVTFLASATAGQVLVDYVGALTVSYFLDGTVSYTKTTSRSVTLAANSRQKTVLLVPVFIRRLCTLAFDVDGGTPQPESTSFRSGVAVTLPSAPTKDGYRFAGWRINGTIYAAGSAVTLYGDATATAVWRAAGGNELVYAEDPEMIASVGDAVVSVSFDPEQWTCEEYGADHDVKMTATPSWTAPTADAASGISIDLPKGTISTAATHTLEIVLRSSCAAAEYSELSAQIFVVVQQPKVGTFWLESTPETVVESGGGAMISTQVSIFASGETITGIREED